MREERTMNKQSHLMSWDMVRLRHGITLRLLEQFPADKLTSHPIAGMRTPVEIVAHIYGSASAIAEAVLAGKLEPHDDLAVAPSIKTREQLLSFVHDAWARADRAANAVSDAQLSAMVGTPWGTAFPGFAMFGFIADEQLHHRGQLYAFLRTFGTEPVMVWDFEHNAPEFQPSQHAGA
jgi:uncharacterized damage-inducible protein DinB